MMVHQSKDDDDDDKEDGDETATAAVKFMYGYGCWWLTAGGWKISQIVARSELWWWANAALWLAGWLAAATDATISACCSADSKFKQLPELFSGRKHFNHHLTWMMTIEIECKHWRLHTLQWLTAAAAADSDYYGDENDGDSNDGVGGDGVGGDGGGGDDDDEM